MVGFGRKGAAGRLFAVAMVAAGCGEDARTVEGVWEVRYVTADGETAVPIDLTRMAVAALVESGDSYDEYVGETRDDGTFSIPDVPEGAYLLRTQWEGEGNWPDFSLETEDTLDLSFYRLGRSDRVAAPDNTRVALDADGLSPWQEGDQLVLYSAEAGAYHALTYSILFVGQGIMHYGILPEVGGTTVEGDIAVEGTLIDASAGDTAVVLQRATSEGEQGTYSTQARVLAPPPFTMDPAETTQLAGTFEEVPQDKTFSARFRREDFEGQIGSIHPDAVPRSTGLSIWALPRWSELGEYDSAPPPMFYSLDPGGEDVDESLAYGDVLPDEWERHVEIYFSADVEFWAPGAESPSTLGAGLGRTTSLDSARQQIEPLVTHVQGIQIGGREARDHLDGVGETPIIEWQPPRVGETPRYGVGIYSVELYEPFTMTPAAAYFRTSETSIRVPLGILEPGKTYFVQVGAFAGDNDDAGWASALSATFTP